MWKISRLTTVLVALFIAACGGDNTLTSGGGGGTLPGDAPPVAGVTVLASSPSLPSDAAQALTISVIVRDTNNVAMEGVTVIMSSRSVLISGGANRCKHFICLHLAGIPVDSKDKR